MQTKKYLIVSAPSGAGKSTVVKYLMRHYPRLAFSVSATTRAPREGEEEGREYYFKTVSQFKRLVEEGAFVEWEEVYENQYYGTLRPELDRLTAAGKIVVFDVDVKGGLHLKRIFGDDALSVFIAPPSLEVLRARLTARGTDSAEQIRRRLDKASLEMEDRPGFDTCIVNDRLEDTYRLADALMAGFGDVPQALAKTL